MAAFSKSDPKRSVIDGVNSDLRCHPLCQEVLHLWVDHAIKLPTIQLRNALIRSAMKSPSSSRAKCPVSSRLSSAFGRSR
jgi:hypothetical protein